MNKPSAAVLAGVAWVLGIVALGALLHHRLQVAETSLQRAPDPAGLQYVGSATCRSCHQDRHRSWHATWHRTMTQEADPRSVQGAFDGAVVEAWGGRMRPLRDADGHWFETLDAQGRVRQRLRIERTVGSHRYQQYLTQLPSTGENYHRLPWLWHNGDQRWVHMNAAFLYSDDQHYDEQVTTWNQNCIFCHNTGPQPRMQNYDELIARLSRGERLDFLRSARYESDAAELGIACEACHGPGSAHAELNRDPVRRYRLALSEAPDPSIVHPERLDPLLSAQVCGQCHGQRLPKTNALARVWLETGPTYRPGQDLFEHVRLVWPEEPGTAANPDLYRARFWGDRTPRLSAYELQGLRLSPCHLQGGLSCNDCHDAHGGDVNGMMRPEARSNATCLGCHEAIAGDVPAHTRHAADSSGSSCNNCHMPELVYGVMEIHRSHRIEIPDVRAARATGRPDACTQCHLDRSSDWAAAQLADWDRAPHPLDDAQVPEHWRQLFAGDPVQRGIAARVAGRAGRALTPETAAASYGALVMAMDDDYPAVRRFAWQSAQTLAPLAGIDPGPAFADYDFTAPAAAREPLRREALRAARRHGATLPDPQQVRDWRAEARARGVDINIGE
jgi:predicted CXXCH cytochrome family protein